MNTKTYKFKIKGLPKNYFNLPFGRQLEYRKVITDFKNGAKSVWLSQKRRSYTKAIQEAIKLYEVDEYYCEFFASENCFDDSFEFWYTVKTPAKELSGGKSGTA